MSYNIIQSNSDGNAIVYFDEILVDVGVSNKLIPNNIKIVLLTHVHGDHLITNELARLQADTGCKVICGVWLSEKLKRCNIEHIAIEMNKLYKVGDYTISAFSLYHDVQNCGYRIFKNDYRIFHATDTCHLDGITAKGYDLYAIEHNYDEDTIYDVIKEKEEKGEFSYEKGAINSHLSFQQANEFFVKNKKEESKMIKLHMSKRYKEVNKEV